MPPLAGAKAIACRGEVRVKHRREYLEYSLLNQAVYYGRYTEQPLTAGRFGYLLTLYRLWTVGSIEQRLFESAPMQM